MFRRAQCSSIILIAGFAGLLVAAPPGSAAAEESFDQLIERVQGEPGIGPADRANARHALEMFVEGRETFRFDTFGEKCFGAIRSACTRRSRARLWAAWVRVFHPMRR